MPDVRAMISIYKGRYLLLAGGTSLYIWSAAKKQIHFKHEDVHKAPILCMARSHTKPFIFTGDAKGTIKKWSTADKALTLEYALFKSSNQQINAMIVTHDDLYLFTTDVVRNIIERWSLKDNTKLNEYTHLDIMHELPTAIEVPQNALYEERRMLPSEVEDLG